MDSIKKFLDFCLFENALQVTSNWYVSTNGQELTKRNNNGYLFLENGTLSIIYKLKDGSETRIDFYGDNKGNEIKTSQLDQQGKDINKDVYKDINSENVIKIVSDFIEGSNPDKMDKYSSDRMVMGLSKTLISFYRTDYIDQSPISYKTFIKVLESVSKNEIKGTSEYENIVTDLLKKFISQIKGHINRKE